ARVKTLTGAAHRQRVEKGVVGKGGCATRALGEIILLDETGPLVDGGEKTAAAGIVGQIQAVHAEVVDDIEEQKRGAGLAATPAGALDKPRDHRASLRTAQQNLRDF